MASPAQPPTFDAKAFLASVTTLPGVYRMYDIEQKILYVGKAKNLKNRLSSYFQKRLSSVKTHAMVAQIAYIEVTVTNTEAEALILENNLIKDLKPRYNILLRDDKSYPYIYLSEQEFPRLAFHRGAKKLAGRFFGPYPSASSARHSLKLLQKLFPVRQCEDSFYRNRQRPCLQYQIKRCTAPCVGLVTEQEYAQDVQHASLFLEGKSNQVIEQLVANMEAASAALNFEKAATIRDQIGDLRRVQESQYVSGEGGDLDIVAVHLSAGVACVQLFFIRNGHNLGNKAFFPRLPKGATEAEVLAAFVPQYYLNKPVPTEILVNVELTDVTLIEQVLSERAQGRVSISHRLRGERARWLEMAHKNAQHALAARLATNRSIRLRYAALQELFNLAEMPERMECFDISHTMGEATVASCVVFDQEGPATSLYRRFNIRDVKAGDDYGALRQAILRRYARMQKEQGKFPAILFIDGGKGQLTQAQEVFDELKIEEVLLVGVSKGPDRKPGMEQIIVAGESLPRQVDANSPALHLIQHIRDEAHRFAITGHRQQRAKTRTQSSLEQIPGMGPKRRQLLLKQFGGLQEVARAGVEDLAKVKGISKDLAQRVYDVFHGGQG